MPAPPGGGTRAASARWGEAWDTKGIHQLKITTWPRRQSPGDQALEAALAMVSSFPRVVMGTPAHCPLINNNILRLHWPAGWRCCPRRRPEPAAGGLPAIRTIGVWVRSVLHRLQPYPCIDRGKALHFILILSQEGDTGRGQWRPRERGCRGRHAGRGRWWPRGRGCKEGSL